MSLDSKKLENDLVQAFIKVFSSDKIPESARKESEEKYTELAKELKKAIEAYVKSGTVKTKVTSTSSRPLSNGRVTGTGNIT